MKSGINNSLIFIFFTLIFLTCKKDENIFIPGITNSDLWIIDTNFLTGSEITYQFPVVTKPIFKSIDEVDQVPDNMTVYICRFDDQTFIFPKNYLWVEAVNHHTENHSFTMTFCPITQSGLIWNRVKSGDTLTFAASGVLYKENLVAYDIGSESMWSQMSLTCIKGDHAYENPEILNFFETNWLTAKEHFTDALVYQSFENNKSNSGFVNTNDTSLYNTGDRVFGIVSGSFIKPVINVINIDKQEVRIKTHILTVKGKRTFVLSDMLYDYIVAFNIDTNVDYFETGDFPVVLSDSEGNYWNIFGYAISGPRTGERLKSAPAFIASWWAWIEFYENITALE